MNEPNASPLRRSLAHARRLAFTTLALGGMRLDRMNVVWLSGLATSLLVAHFVTRHGDWRVSLGFWVGTLLFYYVGNALVLGTRVRAWAVGRWGAKRGWRRYETLLGLMFFNQGLGLSAMCSASVPGLSVPMPDALAIGGGAVLFAVGVGIKVWAIDTLGVDVYFFRDIFLGRALSPFVVRGPYRYFKNPMYGLGQVHAYGYALLMRSVPGLFAAATCHVLIIAVYLVVERPFVQRVHLARRAPVIGLAAATAALGVLLENALSAGDAQRARAARTALEALVWRHSDTPRPLDRARYRRLRPRLTVPRAPSILKHH